MKIEDDMSDWDLSMDILNELYAHNIYFINLINFKHVFAL